jgi:hypothetical protein
MSTRSYNVPISPEGDLPFTLFGRKPNLKHITEKGFKFLICYGAQDDLVEPASALAPLDYIEAEITEFPKGHAAIFTSWANPDSEFALHKVYANGGRGPVRFHLDLDEELRRNAETDQESADTPAEPLLLSSAAPPEPGA